MATFKQVFDELYVISSSNLMGDLKYSSLVTKACRIAGTYVQAISAASTAYSDVDGWGVHNIMSALLWGDAEARLENLKLLKSKKPSKRLSVINNLKANPGIMIAIDAAKQYAQSLQKKEEIKKVPITYFKDVAPTITKEVPKSESEFEPTQTLPPPIPEETKKISPIVIVLGAIGVTSAILFLTKRGA